MLQVSSPALLTCLPSAIIAEAAAFTVILFLFPGLAQRLLHILDVLDPDLRRHHPAVVPVPLPAGIDRAHLHAGIDRHVTATDEAVTESWIRCIYRLSLFRTV